ncbi:MAG: PEP-CTERM sorting domain-containing protein [Planctomycetia bacterium]|nr:PEP-CTERM sorting domain-containing protein [Planctomycetia bacterium]
MIRIASCTVAVGMTVVLLAGPVAAATKVFLLGGQSNMVGYGVVAELAPPYSESQPNVNFWDSGSNQWTALRGGFGKTAAYFGPEMSFGATLKTLFPTDDIYLVKYAAGATNLAVNWNPDGTGTTYNAFQSTVNAALDDLRSKELSPTISGMIWMQGEEHAESLSLATAYGANLEHFIDTVRDQFNASDMRFVIGRITTCFDTHPAGGNALVRAAQETVPAVVGNASCIDTDLLQIGSYAGHYGTQGQIELGIRFADEFVQTPEPSTLILSGTGLLVLAGYWWRNRKVFVTRWRAGCP